MPEDYVGGPSSPWVQSIRERIEDHGYESTSLWLREAYSQVAEPVKRHIEQAVRTVTGQPIVEAEHALSQNTRTLEAHLRGVPPEDLDPDDPPFPWPPFKALAVTRGAKDDSDSFIFRIKDKTQEGEIRVYYADGTLWFPAGSVATVDQLTMMVEVERLFSLLGYDTVKDAMDRFPKGSTAERPHEKSFWEFIEDA